MLEHLCVDLEQESKRGNCHANQKQNFNHLHAEQRHLDPFQDCKRLLNWEKLFSVLKWSGRLFHNVGAANLKDFLPYRVDLICGISKMLLYLKEYLEFFIWTRSWRQTGASLLIILYVSKAMVLILLICKEGTLAFCSNSS
jgi:hypothetical protein